MITPPDGSNTNQSRSERPRGQAISFVRAPARSRLILYVVPEDWYFVTHRLPLAEASLKAGYRVVVATRVGEAVGRIRDAGCEVIALRWPRGGGRPWVELSVIHELARVLRSVRPDLVHYVALKAVVFGNVAERLAGARNARVNAIAGLGYVFSSADLRARLLRPVLKAGLAVSLRRSRSKTIVQNGADAEALIRASVVRPTDLVLIRGVGVDLDSFRPSPMPAGLPCVVFAGRMLWDKGVGDFVEAARRLRQNAVAVRMQLVGAPYVSNPASVSAAQIETWVREGVIEWLGHRTDMPAVLSRASVVCLPSTYGEGVPKILLEAAAAGRPIVTTDTPGCNDVVRHAWNGLLVPKHDPDSLARALQGLLSDPALREDMGRKGRERAELEFSLDKTVSETLRIYDQLLS